MTNTGSVLKQLFSAYPNIQATPETIAVYMRLLRDIAPDDLQTIVDQAIATCKFLPTIAELRDMHHGLQRTALPSWVDGWDAVQSEIRRIGFYGVPHFDDALTAKVVHSMGWRTLCLSETPSIDRAQFRDMYGTLVSRHEYDQKLLPQARELAARNSGLMIPLRDLLEVAKRKDGKGN